MRKITTHIFVYASILFGIIGMFFVATIPDNDRDATPFHWILMRLLLTTVFIILPSFALSVAGKYLNDKS